MALEGKVISTSTLDSGSGPPLYFLSSLKSFSFPVFNSWASLFDPLSQSFTFYSLCSHRHSFYYKCQPACWDFTASQDPGFAFIVLLLPLWAHHYYLKAPGPPGDHSFGLGIYLLDPVAMMMLHIGLS